MSSLPKHTFETEKDDQEPMIAATAVVAETTQVVAPATLVEGATFEASVDGIDFMVVVPPGGVMEGEQFEVPYPSRTTLHPMVKPPSWKVDLCDCCRGGCCMCFVAFLCPLIIHTQVMERLNLTLGGCLPKIGSGPQKRGCGIFLTYFLTIFVIYTMLYICASQQFMPGFAVFYLLFYVLIVFIFVALVCTRASFRKTYNLPPTCCSTGGEDCLDDCCVTYFCSPCSALQMANHSHDSTIHTYECCSKTGLRKHSRAVRTLNTNKEIV